jgi:hypothetical protein
LIALDGERFDLVVLRSWHCMRWPEFGMPLAIISAGQPLANE